MSNSPESSASLKILLVEDSSTSAMLVKTVLNGEKPDAKSTGRAFRLTHVETMKDALAALKAETFDVVLQDLTLPDSSGDETLSRILAATPDTAVVVLTATDDEEMGIRALKAGAQDYLIKDETYPKLLKRAIIYAHERFVGERALRKARDDAQHANQAKSDFLTSMSHEFRTPMNAILGFGQMMQFDTEFTLPDKHREYVEIILKSGEHLLELINDTLDLAKIESGSAEINMEPHSVHDICSTCFDLISPLAEKRNITFRNTVPETGISPVLADSTRLKQVIINLLSNGVKYNSEGGELTLSATMSGDAWVRISVTDTGAGIGPENQQRVFQPFARLERDSSEIEGTGVGLAVTKELVERMGGQIGLDSTVGKGSTFWVELQADPNSEVKVEETKKADALSYGEAGYRLLYIEDNMANKMLIEKVVGRVKGSTFLWAEDAEIGIKMAREEKPDVIIMDINLPGMSGIEALQVLRGLPETSEIPVVALSANAMPYDIERGMKAGFLRYLTKPIDINLFLKAVDGALKTGGWKQRP